MHNGSRIHIQALQVSCGRGRGHGRGRVYGRTRRRRHPRGCSYTGRNILRLQKIQPQQRQCRIKRVKSFLQIEHLSMATVSARTRASTSTGSRSPQRNTVSLLILILILLLLLRGSPCVEDFRGCCGRRRARGGTRGRRGGRLIL